MVAVCSGCEIVRQASRATYYWIKEVVDRHLRLQQQAETHRREPVVCVGYPSTHYSTGDTAGWPFTGGTVGCVGNPNTHYSTGDTAGWSFTGRTVGCVEKPNRNYSTGDTAGWSFTGHTVGCEGNPSTHYSTGYTAG
jgi:hypothetical protein